MEGILQKAPHLLILTAILFVSIATAQPVMLTDSLSTTFGEFVPVSGGRIIFINSLGILSSVNINDPFNTSSFSMGWVPEDNGWDGPGEIKLLRSSPDGNFICAAVQVSIPRSILNSDLSMPQPIIIIVCSSSGEGGAQVVGVTIDSCEELSFDFTQDSRLLYGAGFLPCTSDPENYFALQLGDESNLLPPFCVVDLEEGSRFDARGIIKDHFISNPWSDLIAAGKTPLTTIADMAIFSVIFEDTTIASAVIEQWIEPDAGLAQIDETQILRLADGTVFENQGEPFLILGRISDGIYIFSRDGGESINRGGIHWPTFEVEESTELTELIGYLSPGNKVVTVNADTGIVFRAGRGLYYYKI